MQSKLCSRRTALGLLAAAPATAAQRRDAPEVDAAVVRRHDTMLERLLERQVTDPGSDRRGGCPDEFGLYVPRAAGGIIVHAMAAYLHPQSRFHKANLLVERMRLAASYLDRVQNDEGNVDLPVTNFNSPPDTAFIVHDAGTACALASRAGEREIVAMLEGFLRKAGAAMAVGGIHTPNHRWVVCAALAQIHELFPEERYLRRIDQWLAEGIDIDSDGQYTERSTLTYNVAINRTLIVMAEKLNRPELLDPVRRNLEAMMFLLHPGDELVTEISSRQDQYQRGSAGRHWFALKYIGLRDNDGCYNGLANKYAAAYASLPAIMEYPQLIQPGPPPVAPPDNYEKLFPAIGIARIRRGPVSATVVLKGNSRFLTLRRGEVVIPAVRFAAAFFGRGQFVPDSGERDGNRYVLRQALSAPYYQPLDPPRQVTPGNWSQLKLLRRQTEICHLNYQAAIEETGNGLAVRIQAGGTKQVPLAVEINIGGDGQLSGCSTAPAGNSSFLMEEEFATYREGGHGIRFGPRLREHAYTRVRGAQDKLPGRSVYLTTYTPVDHVIRFEWV